MAGVVLETKGTRGKNMTNQTIIATLLALAAYAAGKKGKEVPKQVPVEKRRKSRTPAHERLSS